MKATLTLQKGQIKDLQNVPETDSNYSLIHLTSREEGRNWHIAAK